MSLELLEHLEHVLFGIQEVYEGRRTRIIDNVGKIIVVSADGRLFHRPTYLHPEWTTSRRSFALAPPDLNDNLRYLVDISAR